MIINKTPCKAENTMWRVSNSLIQNMNCANVATMYPLPVCVALYDRGGPITMTAIAELSHLAPVR